MLTLTCVSTITSTSTIADIEAAYLTNLSYEEDASVSKGKAFVSACRAILAIRPEEAVKGGGGKSGSSLRFNVAAVQAQLEACQRWLAANDDTGSDSSGSVRHVDFANFRS